MQSISGFKENNRVNKGDLFYTPPQKGKKQTKDYTSMKYKLYDIGF